MFGVVLWGFFFCILFRFLEEQVSELGIVLSGMWQKCLLACNHSSSLDARIHLTLYTANCVHNYMVNTSQKGMGFPLNDTFLDAYKGMKRTIHQVYFY